MNKIKELILSMKELILYPVPTEEYVKYKYEALRAIACGYVIRFISHNSNEGKIHYMVILSKGNRDKYKKTTKRFRDIPKDEG